MQKWTKNIVFCKKMIDVCAKIPLSILRCSVCIEKMDNNKGFFAGGENFLAPFIEFSFLCDYIIE